jgi:hypothetical protein
VRHDVLRVLVVAVLRRQEQLVVAVVQRMEEAAVLVCLDSMEEVCLRQREHMRVPMQDIAVVVEGQQSKEEELVVHSAFEEEHP